MTCYRILLCLTIIAGINGCNVGNDNNESKGIVASTSQLPVTTTENKIGGKSYDVDSTLISKLHWVNVLVENYILYSQNELIRLAVKEDLKEEFLWDQFISTDTAQYIVLHIGHDFESKFITDGWLYIDTITRNIYEYDIADDSLIGWKNQ